MGMHQKEEKEVKEGGAKTLVHGLCDHCCLNQNLGFMPWSTLLEVGQGKDRNCF
jgi:hypothetical protein